MTRSLVLREEHPGLRFFKMLSASETPTGEAGGNPAEPVGEQPLCGYLFLFSERRAGLVDPAAFDSVFEA